MSQGVRRFRVVTPSPQPSAAPLRLAAIVPTAAGAGIGFAAANLGFVLSYVAGVRLARKHGGAHA